MTENSNSKISYTKAVLAEVIVDGIRFSGNSLYYGNHVPEHQLRKEAKRALIHELQDAVHEADHIASPLVIAAAASNALKVVQSEATDPMTEEEAN